MSLFTKKSSSEQRDVNYVWVLAGGYLIYMAVKLVMSVLGGSASSALVNIIAAVFFIAVGVYLCLREWNVYRFGYEDGKKGLERYKASLKEHEAPEADPETSDDDQQEA